MCVSGMKLLSSKEMWGGGENKPISAVTDFVEEAKFINDDERGIHRNTCVHSWDIDVKQDSERFDGNFLCKILTKIVCLIYIYGI